MIIDKSSPIPLYIQLKDILLEKIKNGSLLEGEQIPSELELGNTYNLSRTTVREAISILVNDGYLEKRNGIGTFVKEKEKVNSWDLQNLRSFRDELKSQGKTIDTKCKSIETIDKNDELLKIFNAQYEKFYRIERVRSVNNKPVICVTTIVPVDIFPNLDMFNLSEMSLFDIMENHYNKKIINAEKTFQICRCSLEDSRSLNINVGLPMQLVTTKTYSFNNQVIEYSKSRDRGDMSIYKIKINYTY